MFEKLILSIGVGAMACLTTMCTASGVSESPNSIHWETLGNTSDSIGNYYTQRFTIVADGPFERLAFCILSTRHGVVNPEDTLIELYPGYYAVGSPRFAAASAGDTICVDIRTRGGLYNASYAPDGMHLVRGGKAVAACNEFASMIARPEQYCSPEGRDPMRYGAEAYAINDSLRSSYRPSAYMQIPTPKRVDLTSEIFAKPALKVVAIEDPRHDYYKVNITEDTAVVYTNSAYPEVVLAGLQRRLDESADCEGRVPAGIIEDWSDYSYRGFMLDVVRNFTGMATVKHTIDLMSRYGLNMLHFHLGDDEGWRLEIPALPELTAVGGHRGYTTDDDVPFLKGVYSGDGNPDNYNSVSNGFFTTEQYIEILQYAQAKGVQVLPEFDTPGHSRAAIRSMEYRAKHNGDDSYRLIQDGDTSVYTSAQNLHDNTMNPALEGPYKFWSTVFDAIKDVYAQAGVELPGVHIGGDEVARGVWSGAGEVQKLMQREGMDNQRQVHAYFVETVSRIAASKGIKIGGWQEIALNHSAEYDAAVAPATMSINCWTGAGTKGRDIVANGYPLVLTNVDYLYFDQTPNTHPQEPGLKWGGLVDEFRPLHATVETLCPGDSSLQKRVKGISGTLFAETVRSEAMVQRYLLPRILGLAERAHNASATISDSEYFGLLTDEMQRWAADGLCFQLRQPGIIVRDGKVVMNTAYADGIGEIRYTTDGSEPTPESTLYSGPFEVSGVSQIRARMYMNKAWSVTSIHNL